MNPTIKDFSAPIKTVFCSFTNLSSSTCDSICHHALSNPVVMQQLLAGEEKGPCYGRAVLERKGTSARSWHQQHTPAPLHKPHMGCCVIHQPDNWLCWEPVLQGPWQHRNSKTGEQVINEEVFVVAAEVLLLPLVTRAGRGVRPGGCKEPPGNSPRSRSSGRSCLLPVWLCSTSFHIPKAGRGVPDGMCLALAACRAAPVCDEPQQKAAGCSAAGDAWGHPERERVLSLLLPPRGYLVWHFHLRNCRIFSPGLLPRWGEADGSFHSRDAFCSLMEKAQCEGDTLVTTLVMLSCTDLSFPAKHSPSLEQHNPKCQAGSQGMMGLQGQGSGSSVCKSHHEFPQMQREEDCEFWQTVPYSCWNTDGQHVQKEGTTS